MQTITYGSKIFNVKEWKNIHTTTAIIICEYKKLTLRKVPEGLGWHSKFYKVKIDPLPCFTSCASPSVCVCVHMYVTWDWTGLGHAKQVFYHWTMNLAHFVLCEWVLWMYACFCTTCIFDGHRCQQRASGPLELELQTAVNCHVV